MVVLVVTMYVTYEVPTVERQGWSGPVVGERIW